MEGDRGLINVSEMGCEIMVNGDAWGSEQDTTNTIINSTSHFPFAIELFYHIC